MFIDDHELPGPAHLVPVYQFIKDCSISVDYSIEEKAKLINALRSEACSDGAEFSPAIAWQFFIKLVTHSWMQHVHVAVVHVHVCMLFLYYYASVVLRAMCVSSFHYLTYKQLLAEDSLTCLGC